jgi:hypothetical protein
VREWSREIMNEWKYIAEPDLPTLENDHPEVDDAWDKIYDYLYGWGYRLPPPPEAIEDLPRWRQRCYLLTVIESWSWALDRELGG